MNPPLLLQTEIFVSTLDVQPPENRDFRLWFRFFHWKTLGSGICIGSHSSLLILFSLIWSRTCFLFCSCFVLAVYLFGVHFPKNTLFSRSHELVFQGLCIILNDKKLCLFDHVSGISWKDLHRIIVLGLKPHMAPTGCKWVAEVSLNKSIGAPVSYSPHHPLLWCPWFTLRVCITYLLPSPRNSLVWDHLVYTKIRLLEKKISDSH